jgi:hypothetical protein
MLDDYAMPLQASSTVVRVTDHPDFDSYLRALRTSSLLFVPDSPETAACRLASRAGRALLHRLGRRNACIGLDAFSAADLPMLRSICRIVLVRHETRLPERFDDDALRRLEALGFRIFFEYGGDVYRSTGPRQYRLINLAEFAVSNPSRLAQYPAITRGDCLWPASASWAGKWRKVVVLNLVQDFEVLRPLLLKCAASAEWSNTCVAVSDLVAGSHTWEAVQGFLRTLGIPWFTPIGPVDVLNALGGGKAVLITASESTVPEHAFNHEVCRSASPRTARITIQHGYECVGLRHHRGHDRAFPRGVRFASDYVLTWAHPDALPDLHPADRGKCMPVGVIKWLAEDTAAAGDPPGHAGFRSPRKGEPPDSEPLPVLIAENLHSTRFLDPARYQRFRDFILDVNDRGFAVTIRSHPARRTLETGKNNAALNFLRGDLRAKELRQFGIVVSPPSTILLDAVLAGVPAALYSEEVDLGDCANYPGVPAVRDAGQFVELCGDRKAMADIPQANYRWAARNLCAFNGVPQAWSRLNEIAG